MLPGRAVFHPSAAKAEGVQVFARINPRINHGSEKVHEVSAMLKNGTKWERIVSEMVALIQAQDALGAAGTLKVAALSSRG
jgi:hypothetical protein